MAVLTFSLLAPFALADNGLVLSSSVMTDNGTLPEQYGCDGAGVSPPLAWSGVPKGTESLVVLMDHEAGPDDVHWYWTLYNIPTNVKSVSEGSIHPEEPQPTTPHHTPSSTHHQNPETT